MSAFLKNSAIRSVRFYTASPVECCDRCSQGIRYVSLVTYKDGLTQRYGMDCIKKILADAPDLGKLFAKNAKKLQRLTEGRAILTLAPEDMPRGSEYFDSGLFFVADSRGKDIMGGQTCHWYFHPLLDWEKNQGGGRYVQEGTVADYRADRLNVIAKDLPWFEAEIARLEGFLARVLAKASASKEVA